MVAKLVKLPCVINHRGDFIGIMLHKFGHAGDEDDGRISIYPRHRLNAEHAVNSVHQGFTGREPPPGGFVLKFRIVAGGKLLGNIYVFTADKVN